MTKTKILERFGLRIKELRLDAKLTQEELADKANLHYTYIGVVERGKKNISLINIEKIAKALGVNLATFFSSFK